MVFDGRLQLSGLLCRDDFVDHVAIDQATPFVIRAMAGVWIICAPTIGFAALFHTLYQTARADQVNGGDLVAELIYAT